MTLLDWDNAISLTDIAEFWIEGIRIFQYEPGLLIKIEGSLAGS